jgi:hypothetical protein
MDLPASEVADVLRRVATGQQPIDGVRHDPTHLELRAGGWTIGLFIDVDEFDYVERAQASDGRTADFDDWWREIEGNPLDLLTDAECEALAARLEV